jgi:hypothetical protein
MTAKLPHMPLMVTVVRQVQFHPLVIPGARR